MKIEEAGKVEKYELVERKLYVAVYKMSEDGEYFSISNENKEHLIEYLRNYVKNLFGVIKIYVIDLE